MGETEMEFQFEAAQRTGRPRRVWIAVVFSILLCGLGQIYNGQMKKGVVFYLLTNLIGVVFYVLAGNWISIYVVAVAGLTVLVIHLCAIIDAGRVAHRIGPHFRPAGYNRPLAYIGIYLVFGVLFSFTTSAYIKQQVVQAFQIPAGSMTPTLVPGDHILVAKNVDTFSRGDVVVFEFPEDEGQERPRDFVKRIVGLPGDEIDIRDKQLFVNGQPEQADYAVHLEENLIDARDQYGPVIVPEGMYFVLGDNRDRSFDSRFWGFVAREKLRGKAVQIYWSWDREVGSVRWERIGERINQG